VLASSAGSAAVLAGIVQTPGLGQLFGCTPLGPVAWAIAGSATAGATVITALLPVLPRAALPGVAATDVHPEVAEPPAEHPLLAIAGS
jgi:cation-transporting ATPase I